MISDSLRLLIEESFQGMFTPHRSRLIRAIERELDNPRTHCEDDSGMNEHRLLREIAANVQLIVKQTKPRLRWNVVIRPLEPMKKERPIMDTLKLGQIPLGMRLPVDFTPDEKVDVKSDGKFASVTVLEGDSSAQIADGSTANSWRAYFNGDGALGQKSAEVAADGHVGPEDVEVTQRVEWEVISKDATSFTAKVGSLEPIPTP